MPREDVEAHDLSPRVSCGHENIVEKHLNDKNAVDDAMALAKQTEGIVIDEETNRRLLRKIDMWLTPLMCLVYAIQYMDKTSNAYASIMGIREDLHMDGDKYSWTGTAFYLGYLVFEIPGSLILQRFPLGKTTGTFVILWGIVLTVSAAPNNYPGFEALRTLLGVLESGVTPAFVLITAQWYKREEQFLRTALWFCCNGLGTILGALIAYGLLHREQTSGTPIESWRLLFIVIGIITIVLGILCVFHIPDNPSKAWFLTPEERLQVVERIRSNKQGFGNKHFRKDQLKEVARDPRTYIMFSLGIVQLIPNGGLTSFQNIILTSLGYDPIQALLMNTPGGAVEIVVLPLLGLVAQYTQRRMPVAIFGCAAFLIGGTCLIAFPKSTHAQLAGLYMFQASPVIFVCLLSVIASNTAGYTKKVVTQGLFMVAYATGNMIGPLTFKHEEAPHYTSAKIAMVVSSCITLCLLCTLYLINWLENKRRDKANVKLNVENSEFADLTDFQNPEFRYAL